MNTNDRKKIVKLIQPNVMPNSIRIVVSVKEDIEVVEQEENYDFSGMSKSQLVELLEQTVQTGEILSVKKKIGLIRLAFLELNKIDLEKEKAAFLAAGNNEADYVHADDELEIRFKAALDIYKKEKGVLNEKLEKEKQENLEKKRQIINEINALIDSEEMLKVTYDAFHELQARWKEIGDVPPTERTNLWECYHFACEKFYNKVKINQELRDLDLKKNLEAKIQICEKTEELISEPSVIKAFQALQKFHEQWKEIGPVPQDKKDVVWERFKAASDKINAVRRDHYTKIEEEQNANYQAKLVLCEKMEALVAEPCEGISSFNKQTEKVNAIFADWKAIGQAPKKVNDEVWTRFKTAMDSFFNAKKEFNSKVKDEQTENLNRKIQLCIDAEGLSNSQNWAKTTQALKKLQEEWKTIGPVVQHQSEKVWKRFRAACDVFFNAKNEYFSKKNAVEEDNATQKRVLLERIRAYELVEDRNANLEAIKEFQREWMKIGFVPNKEKQKLQDEYRELIDALFAKIRKVRDDASTEEFQEMVNAMKEAPDAREKMRSERINLQKHIARLNDEIHTLENNIGFFANSKQAGVLVAEYEKKIVNLKNDLKVLEAKLKMLNA